MIVRPRASHRMRHGMGRAGMVIMLCAVLLGLGGFWTYRWVSEGTPTVVSDQTEWYLACKSCEKVTTIPDAEARGRAKDDSGKLQCPQCNEFAAEWVASEEEGKLFLRNKGVEAP